MTCDIDKTTKTCTKCGETKPIEEFSRNKRSRDGRQSHCKTCKSAKRKAWYGANKERELANAKVWREANKSRMKAWYEANRERRSVIFKAWYEANKDRKSATARAWYEANKDRHSARQKEWRDANKDRKSATNRAWYEANKDRQSATFKAWCEANPEARAAHRQRRRATKLQQTPLAWFTQEEIDKQYARVKRHCRKQSKALGIQWDVDHVVPLNGMIGGTAGTKVVSGLHWGGNFEPLPSEHNSSKQCYEWPDMWEYGNTYYDEETGTLLEREPNQVGDPTWPCAC